VPSVNSGVLRMQAARRGPRTLSVQHSGHVDRRKAGEQSMLLLDDIATQDAYTVRYTTILLQSSAATARQPAIHWCASDSVSSTCDCRYRKYAGLCHKSSFIIAAILIYGVDADDASVNAAQSRPSHPVKGCTRLQLLYKL